MKNDKKTATAALVAILVAINFVVGIVYLLPEGIQDALAAFIAVVSVIIVFVCLFIWARAVASKKGGDRQRDQRKKRVSWPWAAVAAAVVFYLLALAGNSETGGMAVFFSAVSIVLAAVGFLKGKKKARDQAGPEQGRARSGGARQHRVRQREDRPLPTATQRSFSPAVYDETLREDSAALDRQRRLEQLEGFYKNGIVSREEYMLLRQRYEK